jgi:hypothetical protein
MVHGKIVDRIEDLYDGGVIAIRNPTGKCDHLYYPENVNKSFKKKCPDCDCENETEIDKVIRKSKPLKKYDPSWHKGISMDENDEEE